MNPKHPPDPPMDLANMRRQGVRHHEINHLAESANFLAAYEAGDEQALWQAIVYCAGHHIPLWEWLANELLMPWQRQPHRRAAELEEAPGMPDSWEGRPAWET
jgi:hypothetical protein